jgi:hypothetical protein
VPLGKKAIITASGIKYVDRTDYVAETDAPEELAAPVKPKRTLKPRQKSDPKHIAAARELRDRYLEQINRGAFVPQIQGRYDVSRQLAPTPTTVSVKPMALLDAA